MGTACLTHTHAQTKLLIDIKRTSEMNGISNRLFGKLPKVRTKNFCVRLVISTLPYSNFLYFELTANGFSYFSCEIIWNNL